MTNKTITRKRVGGGYMNINGTMIYEYGTNHLLSVDGIYSLPTSGTVNIEYQVMD